MSLPRPEDLNRLHANICRALADPKRILILYTLNLKPRHVSALAEDLGIPQPTVSRHLGILRRQSLVTAERDGPSMVYRVADERVIEVLNILRILMFESMARQSDYVETGAEMMVEIARQKGMADQIGLPRLDEILEPSHS